MSFRGRLTLFFVLIVVVPIVAVALLVVGITSASRSGKADARLAGGVHTPLPETDLAGAIEVAERIRARVEAEEVPVGGPGGVIRITASIGVASLPDSASDVEMLIAAADAALYEAKRNGKNRVVAAPAGAAQGRGARRGGPAGTIAGGR